MAILHTVNKSPFERDALASCLRLAKEGSSILLIEDGVYGAMQGGAMSDKISAVMPGVKLYVLGPDYKARGCSADRMISGVESVDYAGFVELTTTHDTVQAWL